MVYIFFVQQPLLWTKVPTHTHWIMSYFPCSQMHRVTTMIPTKGVLLLWNIERVFLLSDQCKQYLRKLNTASMDITKICFSGSLIYANQVLFSYSTSVDDSKYSVPMPGHSSYIYIFWKLFMVSIYLLIEKISKRSISMVQNDIHMHTHAHMHTHTHIHNEPVHFLKKSTNSKMLFIILHTLTHQEFSHDSQ
jgi:hypothetical protein